jgi:DNA invertase Pin-like site-specific DNA recombinase
MKIDRVALYARVSTLAGQNPEMQLVELREYAARRGWLVAEEYVDHGVSGAKESRPALNRLMADASQRKFDVVACWKLDRFGRSVKHVVTALADFEVLGIAFVSLKDNLDLSTASGRFMFQIIAAFAELERAIIAERVRSGLQNAVRRGKKLGRRPVAVDKARIARLRANGTSLRAISAQLGLSLGTVHKAARAYENP